MFSFWAMVNVDDIRPNHAQYFGAYICCARFSRCAISRRLAVDVVPRHDFIMFRAVQPSYNA